MEKFVMYYFKKHSRNSVLLLVLGGCSALTSVLMNYSLEYMVDYVFGTEGRKWGVALLLFALMAISTYLSDQWGENYLAAKYQKCFERDMRRRLIANFLKKPYASVSEMSLGECMTLDELVDDVGEIYITLSYHLPYCLLESVGIILFLGIAVSWKINVILAILIPFAIILKNWLKK